jgi:hypothetical protein
VLDSEFRNSLPLYSNQNRSNHESLQHAMLFIKRILPIIRGTSHDQPLNTTWLLYAPLTLTLKISHSIFTCFVRFLQQTSVISPNSIWILVGKPEGKRPLGRPRRRWVDNIKMDLRDMWLWIWTSGGLL